MPETTPLIKAALNLRVGAGFDVYVYLGNYFPIKMGRRKPPNLLGTWRLDSDHLLFILDFFN